MKWLVLIVLAIAAAQLYVRLAPTSLETWNVAGPAKPPGDYSGRNWFEARRAVAPDVLGRLDVVAEETARTRRLGGDLTRGPVTWETRSLLWGFPDYTTAWLDEQGNLAVLGRSRFGYGDGGVNRRRVQGWLSQLGLTG
ncbi:DUF1499 domain-containing protein [Wenxinia saemankumensis]|uniref:DUF1499 domain-containing protein n=1 Tax=Wenxinia saemankumensis TaxID=1447782 RepID=A0A1M6A895_9RHOB|nr:DUF1499 domain-containing protein [Wenxinia saemankumensis]SHI32667.1 Protein of unknown function [Wenxinia saemankumensis]